MRELVILGIAVLAVSQNANAGKRKPLPEHERVAAPPVSQMRPLVVPSLVTDPAKGEVKIQMDLPVQDESKLTGREKGLLEKIRKGAPISFQDITEIWLEMYLREFNAKTDQSIEPVYLQSLLKRLAELSPSEDPYEFKRLYERVLRGAVHKKDLVYNVDHKNPVDVLLNNKMQCASGSLCYALLSRTAWGAQKYSAKNPVFIFQKGHMLPGFVSQDGVGNTWLTGVETTLSGTGREPIGKTSELSKAKEPLRVVDANLYPILDIFKKHLSPETRSALGREILEKTAEKYKLDLNAMETGVRDQKAAKDDTENTKTDDSGDATFGFGKVEVPPGDLERPYQTGEQADPAGEVTRRNRPQPLPSEGEWVVGKTQVRDRHFPYGRDRELVDVMWDRVNKGTYPRERKGDRVYEYFKEHFLMLSNDAQDLFSEGMLNQDRFEKGDHGGYWMDAQMEDKFFRLSVKDRNLFRKIYLQLSEYHLDYYLAWPRSWEGPQR